MLEHTQGKPVKSGFIGYGIYNELLNELQELKDNATLRANNLTADEITRVKAQAFADGYGYCQERLSRGNPASAEVPGPCTPSQLATELEELKVLASLRANNLLADEVTRIKAQSAADVYAYCRQRLLTLDANAQNKKVPA